MLLTTHHHLLQYLLPTQYQVIPTLTKQQNVLITNTTINVTRLCLIKYLISEKYGQGQCLVGSKHVTMDN